MPDLNDWEIVGFEILEGYVLDLRFRDGTRQTIDFEPVIGKGWMRRLKEPSYFRSVRLNDGGNLEWPDGQDFNPEALHNWQEFKERYIEDVKAMDD